MSDWTTIAATIVAGHRVASGENGDPLFPGGTLKMQTPHFRRLGLDLTDYHSGTLNVSIAPLRYQVIQPRLTFRNVKWHSTEPAEDFSFFDVRLIVHQTDPLDGLIYYPHPDTKPTHFQRADVLEVLLPFVDGLRYGMDVCLKVSDTQILIHTRM